MANAFHTYYPGAGQFAGIAAVNPSFTLHTFDASTDAIEWIFQMPEAATITQIGVRVGAAVGTPTDQIYEVELQGVTSGMRADGTVKGATNNAQGDLPVATSLTAGDVEWVTLGETYAAARGEHLAVVLKYRTGGTLSGTNGMTFTYRLASAGDTSYPIVWTVNGGVGSVSTAGWACFGVASSSKTYGLALVDTLTSETFLTTKEVGMVFTVPSGWGSTFKVVGARYLLSGAPGTGATHTLKLYDSDLSTVLQSVVLDIGDVVNSVGSRWVYGYFDEATLSTLSHGTKYYCTVLTSASNGSMRTFDYDRAQDLDQLPGGQAFYVVTGTSASWSEAATRRPMFDLILDDITEPSASSGLMVHPGMAGGMRG